MKKLNIKTIAIFFNITRQTVYRCLNNNESPALKFTKQYLDDEAIFEFLETGKILKFENKSKYPLQDKFLQKISDEVNNYYNNKIEYNTKQVLKSFIIETNYQIPYYDLEKFLINISEIKDGFYEKYFTYLHKHRNKFDVNIRREANAFMHYIFEKDEFRFYFFLCNMKNL